MFQIAFILSANKLKFRFAWRYELSIKGTGGKHDTSRIPSSNAVWLDFEIFLCSTFRITLCNLALLVVLEWKSLICVMSLEEALTASTMQTMTYLGFLFNQSFGSKSPYIVCFEECITCWGAIVINHHNGLLPWQTAPHVMLSKEIVFAHIWTRN